MILCSRWSVDGIPTAGLQIITSDIRSACRGERLVSDLAENGKI